MSDLGLFYLRVGENGRNGAQSEHRRINDSSARYSHLKAQGRGVLTVLEQE